jgi:AraC-like DNA-binding protein
MKLFIKNMVCNRCKTVVRSELENYGLSPLSVELGDVEIAETLNKSELDRLNTQLQQHGFEIIDDRRNRVTEKVKNLIIELVQSKDNYLQTNLSDYLAQEIGSDYSYISNLFSQQESITIEQFYILQRIERVKELLVYDEMNLNEIASLLNYSSASHLTKQFKKITGLTPTFFKQLKEQKRKPLDNL